MRQIRTLFLLALMVSLAPAQASPTPDGTSDERASISLVAHAPVQINVQRLAQVVSIPPAVETCGQNGSGIKLCLQGKPVCVAPYLVQTYLRYGATMGGCQVPCVVCLTDSEDVVQPTGSEKVSTLEKAEPVFGLEVK